MSEEVDFPDAPFDVVDPVAAALLHTLKEGFGSWGEMSSHTPERLMRVRDRWNKASGGWKLEFQGSLRDSDPPERLTDHIDDLRRDAFLCWLDAKPFEGAEEVAADLRCPPPQRLASLYEYAAEYLGKSKREVDDDIANSYWPILHELPDSLQEAFYETERDWLEGSYWYICEVTYYLPDDSESLWSEPVVRVELQFSSDEYARRADSIGGFTVAADAFREGIIPLLETKIITVFQEQ